MLNLNPRDASGTFAVMVNGSGYVEHLSPDMIAYKIKNGNDVNFVGFGY